MSKKYFFALLFSVTAGISVAKADQSDVAGNIRVATPVITEQPMFQFGGFGTLGAAHSSLGLGDFVPDTTLPKGAGRSHDWSLGDYSKIAAQVNATFNQNVSAVFQVISEYNSDGTYKPEIEWANVKYSFNPNAYVRVGRIAWPTFLDSETRDVGYSYIWAYPPADLYHQLSIPSSDGIDAAYRFSIGEAENSVKMLFGKNSLDRPTSVTTSEGMWGVFDNLEYGQATFHLGYQQRRSSSRSFTTGVSGPWIENSDLSVGVNYDTADWFVKSEWIQRRSTYKTGAMYASAGYRVDTFTPYVTHSQNSEGSLLQSPATLSAAELQRVERSQSSNSVGLRWDFMRNFDFKLQYDRITLGASSNGYLINVPAGLVLYGTTFHVISAVVDFVF